LSDPLSYSVPLCQYIMHHLSPYVGQPKIPSLKFIRQSFVIKSQLMQNGSMQIMDVNPVAYSIVPNFVGFTVTHPSFDSSSRHPHGKRLQVMISSVKSHAGPSLHHRRPAKLSTPNDQSFIQ